MEEFIRLLIGVVVLLLGFPIGNFLAKKTKEELKAGERWFRLLVSISLLGGLIGMFFRNDFVMFSCLFVAIVTGRSLKSTRSKR